MKTVFVAGTGVRVSALAMGTMSFGGDADEATAAAMYRRSREAGVNHYDTADIYNGGDSERILGRLIAGERDEIVLASKAYFPRNEDPNARGSSRLNLVRAVEASLTRLGTDRIELFYLHRFDECADLEETLRAVEDLVRSGKILYPAVSNFSAWQTMKGLGISARRGWSPIVAIQPMYNLAKRQAEVELLPMAASENVAVFPYSPLGGGLLTGKYGVRRRPDAGRLVQSAMYLHRYGDPANYELAESFTALAAELGHHPVTLAIAWVASHSAVTAPLIGARNLEQLEPALAAGSLSLDAATRARVSALSPEPPPATDRNEERAAAHLGAR